MIHLRITTDGRITGLWHDEVDFAVLGRLRVQRASYIEFDNRLQRWTIREAVPCERWRRLVQRLFGRPMGVILYHASTRTAALAWEQANDWPVYRRIAMRNPM